ncbi:MAG: hypothetical protein ROZ00_04875 [Denitratisoma sp.]|nr:hypothetical protein [Denitratisoma sp.]
METSPTEPMPGWATGEAASPMQMGAQLRTRDGRRIGNAVTVGMRELNGKTYAAVVTDAGTWLNLTNQELDQLFHPPQWLMRIEDHPAMNRQGYRIALDDLRILADAVCALDAATLPDDKRLVTGCHTIIRRALGTDFQLIYCEEDAAAAQGQEAGNEAEVQP